MKYSGSAQVLWTPYEINIADFGSPEILIGYGQESIKVEWTAEGQADPAASNFVLDQFTLSGTVHVDNVFGVPAVKAPPPIVCDYSLSQIEGAKLHVHHFPQGGTLRDFTGGGFTGDYFAGPQPGQDTWRPDFPLDSQYVQVNNDKPECQPNFGMMDWTVSRILPNYPRDQTGPWANAVTAAVALMSTEGPNLQLNGYEYSGAYNGPFDVDPKRPLPRLTNANYTVLIVSNVSLGLEPANDNPFGQP
jgi:hypothetical protein